ncbi:MAG: type VI secretion system membrane subunit TssM [Burkholderiales bacterium]|nr:type VI secretion system membrane subunit TssM [Burkholderiales bacterium]
MSTAVNVNTGVNAPSGIGKFFRFLVHPWFLALLGVIAISALVWYVGPLISIGESRPLDPTWIRVTVIAVLFGLLILRVIFGVWNQRRANAALVNGMTKGPSSADKEIATLNERFSQALDVLKKAPGKGKGALLYQLPWYIFIGAPGSGKTTALMNAGLTFPLAEKMGGASVRGVGGTRNCDWWFTDEAVLIDTAGRYTTQESNSEVDASAWDGFLALLRKSRPRRPINGVLLTINIQDLLQQTPVERKDHAAKLRARMQELAEKLGVRAPVYVLVTKADLIAGFNESFGALNKEERNQVWGFTFPYTPTSTDDPLVNFGSEFAALEKGLRDRVVPLMDAEHEVLKRAAIFNFPQQFAGLRGLLGGFLEQVFSAGGTMEERPLLRGVYFTSGTQEGTPIDRVLGTLSRTFGIERRLPPPAAARGKSFFLNRLLKDVVFNEQGLVGENRAMEARRGRLRVAGFALVLLASIGLIVGWAVSYSRNKSYISEIEAKLPELKKTVDALPPATSGDVTPVPPVLTAVRTAAYPAEFNVDAPPWSMSLGLYQGRKLDAAADVGYQHLLDHALMPRVVRRLEERLRAANKDNLEQAYEALKNYLMIYTPDKFDADSFKAYVGVDWDVALERTLAPEQRKALDEHLDAMLTHGAPPPAVAMDKNLVAGVRDMLVAFPLEYRVFSRLKRAQIGADIPPFTVAGAAGPASLNVFERASGEPLTKGIPGLFTKEGYRKAFETSVDKATRQLASEETWVLGLRQSEANKSLPLGKANPELTNRVRRLYFEEYIKVWDKYIADVRVIKLDSLEKSLQVARQLSGVDSPLAAFLRGVARETTLVEPKPAAGSTSGTRVGNVDQKAEQAKREMAAVLGKVNIPGADAAPTGPPLEQMVDDHFEPIRRLMAGTPPPMDEIMKMFNEVYVQLAAVDAAQKSKSAPPPSGGGERVKAAAGQLPEPARSALEKVAGAAATSGRAVEREGLTSELKPISEFCNRAITGRYPFTSSSKADVLPEDFSQLFGAGGAFDTFYATKLASLVDTGTNPWSFKPTGDGTKPVNAAALVDFQRAARIKEVFFRSGGKTPSFKVDIRAVEMEDGMKEMNLEIDGTVFKFLAGNTTPVTVTWPSARVASQIKLSTTPGTNTIAFDGPWALFRLFERFDVQPTAQPERFVVPMLLEGRRARFEVTASSVFNPFRLKEIQQFRCPGSL